MIRHAVRHVRAYAELEAQLGSQPDLSQLPLLDGGRILRDYASLRARSIPPEAAHLARQTEPSGLRLAVLMDSAQRTAVDQRWRALSPEGGDRVLTLPGDEDHPPDPADLLRRFPGARLLPTDWEAHLQTSGPRPPDADILVASALELDEWACLALKDDLRPSLPPITYLTGAPLDPWRIQRIEQTFATEAHQRIEWFEGLMGLSSDGGPLGSAVDTHLEILDADGQTVVDGHPGALVLTSLCNLSMPLLRYRTRLIAVREEGAGGGLRVLGTEEDLPVGEPEALSLAGRCLAAGVPPALWGRVRRIRCRVEKGRLQLLVHPGQEFARPGDDDRLRGWLEDQVGPLTGLALEVVSSEAARPGEA